MNSRGQQWEVFKLLQGAVIAGVMLTIIWGVVSMISHQVPNTDPLSVGTEQLKSAYAAAETGQFFSGEAFLTEIEFTADVLAEQAGLSGVTVHLRCPEGVCEGSACQSMNGCTGDTPVVFEKGHKVKVCSKCPGFDECYVVYMNGCEATMI